MGQCGNFNSAIAKLLDEKAEAGASDCKPSSAEKDTASSPRVDLHNPVKTTAPPTYESYTSFTQRYLLKDRYDEVEAVCGQQGCKGLRYDLLLVGLSNLLIRVSSVVVRWRIVGSSEDDDLGHGVNAHRFSLSGKILLVILIVQLSADLYFIALSFMSFKSTSNSEVLISAILNAVFFLECVAFVIGPFCSVPALRTDQHVVFWEGSADLTILVSIVLTTLYFNGVFRIRLSISFWFQMVNPLIFFGSDLIRMLLHSSSFAVAQALFVLTASLLGITIIWLAEQKDGPFFAHPERKINLSTLVEHILNRQRHAGTSKLEDLFDMLLSVETLALIGSRHECDDAKRTQDMREIAELSQRCVTIVMSGDLFSANANTGINSELNDDVRRFILNQQAHQIARHTHEQIVSGSDDNTHNRRSTQRTSPKATPQSFEWRKRSLMKTGAVRCDAAQMGEKAAGPSPSSYILDRSVGVETTEETFKFPQALAFVGVDAKRNVLPVEKEVNNHLLSQMGFSLLKRMGSLETLGCAEQTAMTFLQRIENLYFPGNPYHNATHAASVAHQSLTYFNLLDSKHCISSSSKGLTKIGLWIAALAHDVNHPAKSNAYLINSQHSLAVVYNDIHVLENFHCAVTFQTLQGPTCNIFENLNPTEHKFIRTLIVDLILATDMKDHFDILARFRVAHANSTLTTEMDSLLTMKIVIKAADIGHSVLKWEDHLEWSTRVVAEFYAQGDEEEERNMSKSPLCDRSKVSEIGDSQAGFLQFVVQPLYEEMIAICDSPAMHNLLKTIKSNVNKWKNLKAESQQALEENLEAWKSRFPSESAANRPTSSGAASRESVSFFAHLPKPYRDGLSPTADNRRRSKSIAAIPKLMSNAHDVA